MDQNSENSGDSGVKFQDTGWQAPKSQQLSNTPKIVQLVMKFSGGSVKTEKQANYVLLGFSALIIAIALYLFFG